MKLFKQISGVLFLTVIFMALACCGDHDEPEAPQQPEAPSFSENILGEWLLASSTAEEWASYDFKKTQQMTGTWFDNNIITTGVGMFFTSDEKGSLTASVNIGKDKTKYIDWIAKKIQAFQIDIDVYGGKEGNEFLGANAIYKIVGEQEIEYGTNVKVDYRKFTGTNDCSDFVSLDESIVKVNANGDIECLRAGNTFIVFSTPSGHAVIKVKVQDKILSFAENILGTWVTDVIGYVWERDVYGDDGYFYSQWSREGIFPTSNESAQGSYKIDESSKIISISAKTPYNQRLNVDYHITSIDRFSFDTDCYSGGDKTGAFYFQRVLSSLTIEPKATLQPNYYTLVGSSSISGYSSHDEKIATVDNNTGLITGISKGTTYIDVITNNGTGVVEVNVSADR